MPRRVIRLLAQAAVVLLIALLVAAAGVYLVEERALSAQARATPQVDPQTASAVSSASALRLPTGINVATVGLLTDRYDDVVVIDVRSQAEYDSGHVPGARLMPLGELGSRVDELPRDGLVVVTCRSGNRSSRAVSLLQDVGFTNAHDMLGGMRAWSKAGLPVEP